MFPSVTSSQYSLQNVHDLLKAKGIRFGEAGEARAVDIQDAPDGPVFVDRDHDLGIGGAVAGDMARKGMDIRYQLGGIFRHGSTADALAHRNSMQAVLP